MAGQRPWRDAQVLAGDIKPAPAARAKLFVPQSVAARP
jgi:hypothetical protein